MNVNPPKRKLPRRFEDLAAILPPRSIRRDSEHEAAVEMIDQLMRVPRLSDGQQRYLETLLVLVEAYELEHHAIGAESLSGVGVLQHLMEQNQMSVEELGGLLGVSRSHAYNLLRGVRALTVDHLRALGDRFKVEPSLFL